MNQREYIDLPDHHYGIIAFVWSAMFSPSRKLFGSYVPVEIGHYYWRELDKISIDRAVICPTMAQHTHLLQYGAEWGIDPDEAVFVPDKVIEGWSKLHRAYVIHNAEEKQGELGLLAAHYGTPESH